MTADEELMAICSLAHVFGWQSLRRWAGAVPGMSDEGLERSDFFRYCWPALRAVYPVLGASVQDVRRLLAMVPREEIPA